MQGRGRERSVFLRISYCLSVFTIESRRGGERRNGGKSFPCSHALEISPSGKTYGMSTVYEGVSYMLGRQPWRKQIPPLFWSLCFNGERHKARKINRYAIYYLRK